MAEIKPFRAYRPRKDLTERIAALPYDVYNREEARIEAAKDPLSFLNIDRPETQFEPGHDLYAPEVYRRAAGLLWEMIQKGYFVRDDRECFYLYELTMDDRSQTGVVGCTSVDDYQNGVVKKHENTRAEKEADRIRHVDVCNMQTGPIFLAYHSCSPMKAIIDDVKTGAAQADFVSEDGVRHRVWVIDHPAVIQRMQQLFREMGGVYIADGHHRCASAAKVSLMRRAANPGHTGQEAYNTFLSVLFSEDELKIMDYNRVLLAGPEHETLMKALAEHFSVEGPFTEMVRPAKKGELGLCDETGWYRLSLHPERFSDDPVEGLDVALLQRYVLAPVYGIEDPKTDPRIDFVGGIRGLSELEHRVKLGAKAAFAMYPTSIQELFAVADSGELMPPKSTWFEPKLRSGLFLHSLEND